nr:integrase, catalytic region, zinc finger, CCHC-type, peptidase aspartic, catalytic [Tanacetum cinerariifolium]
MSNTNNNMQTQTSSALHNAIMEAGGKDRPPMLAPVDACPNAMEMWKEIKRLKQGESINVQDLETNLYYEFGKFTSQDCESLYSYYSRGKAIANFPLPTYEPEPDIVADEESSSKEKEIDKLMALISMSFKKIYKPMNSNHKTSSNTRNINVDNTLRSNKGIGYDRQIEKYDNQRAVNVVGLGKISSTRSQAATRNRGKAIANFPLPTYEPEPDIVADEESSSKEKEIDKLMALISMSFKKIYKPMNSNHKTSSNTRNINVDNTLRSNKGIGYDRQIEKYDNQRAVNVVGLGKMLYSELEAHYMYMEKIQKVTPDASDNSRPIFDAEPFQKVHNNDDDYNVFANDKQHPEQHESVNDTYLVKQCDTNITSDSSNMSNTGEEADQDDQVLQKERCSNDNLALILAPETDETIRLAQEIRSKLTPETDETIRLAQEIRSKLGVISITSVSRPQLKSNRLKDRVFHNNGEGKKQQVEYHHKNFKFSNNKTTKKPIVVLISTREPKRTVNQSFVTPHRKTVASKSTIQKPRSTVRNLYERVSRTCGTVQFGNDQFALILGYEDLVQGNVTIKRVYCVKGLNHNLFSVCLFCDVDLEVAFENLHVMFVI